MVSSEQRAWVLRVLGVDTRSADMADGVKERLAAVGADLKRVPGGAGMATELRAAIDLARDGSPGAESVIEALEDKVAELTRASRVAAMTAELAAARPSRAGFVAVAKARLAWAEVEAGYEEAAGNLVDSAYALLETPPYSDDPRASAPEAAGLIEALRGRLPPLGDVSRAVNAALDGDGPGRAAAVAEAVKVIDGFLPRLDEEKNLVVLETAAGNYPSVSLIRTTLRRLRAVLDGMDAAEPAAMRSAA